MFELTNSYQVQECSSQELLFLPIVLDSQLIKLKKKAQIFNVHKVENICNHCHCKHFTEVRIQIQR